MCQEVANVWLEIQGGKQKTLITTVYREFSNLVTKGQMSDIVQRERWEIFMNQAKKASKEGYVLAIGDMNLDLARFEDSTYYKKQLAEQYQASLGEGGFETIDFGHTWKNRSIDHAFVNKPGAIKNHGKIKIHYSDHMLIYVDTVINFSRKTEETIISRDMRKLRANPQHLVKLKAIKGHKMG